MHKAKLSSVKAKKQLRYMPAAAELESPAVSGPPFLNLIMGTWGFTVENLLRRARLADTEDMVDGLE